MTLTQFSLTLVAPLIIASQAWAETVNYHGQIGASVRHFHYQEFDDSGRSLNKEDGFIPGLSILGDASLGNIRLSASAEIFDGTVSYDGHLQTGEPYKTDTDTEISSFSMGASWQPGAMLPRLFCTLQHDVWERDIQPKGLVSGLFEEYVWYTVKLGIAKSFKLTETLSLELAAGPTRTKDARITIHLSPFGYGNHELKLPAKSGYFLAATLAKMDTGYGSVNFELEQTHFEFGKSDPKTLIVGTRILQIHEPGSESDHTTLRLGYRFEL